jgi:hypothetical protein
VQAAAAWSADSVPGTCPRQGALFSRPQRAHSSRSFGTGMCFHAVLCLRWRVRCVACGGCVQRALAHLAATRACRATSTEVQLQGQPSNGECKSTTMTTMKHHHWGSSSSRRQIKHRRARTRRNNVNASTGRCSHGEPFRGSDTHAPNDCPCLVLIPSFGGRTLAQRVMRCTPTPHWSLASGGFPAANAAGAVTALRSLTAAAIADRPRRR